MYKIKYFPDEDHAPMKEFLSDLVKSGQKQKYFSILRYVEKLKEFGFEINEKFKSGALRKLEEDLWELKPSNIRVFVTYIKESHEFYLLHAFKKEKNTTPSEEKKRARNEIRKLKKNI